MKVTKVIIDEKKTLTKATSAINEALEKDSSLLMNEPRMKMPGRNVDKRIDATTLNQFVKDKESQAENSVLIDEPPTISIIAEKIKATTGRKNKAVEALIPIFSENLKLERKTNRSYSK